MCVLTWSGFIARILIDNMFASIHVFRSEKRCHKMSQKKKTHSSNTSLKTYHVCLAHTIPCSLASQTWLQTCAIPTGGGAQNTQYRFLTPLRTPTAKSFHHWLVLVSQHHSHATGRPSCSGWLGNQAGKKNTSRFALMFCFSFGTRGWLPKKASPKKRPIVKDTLGTKVFF